MAQAERIHTAWADFRWGLAYRLLRLALNVAPRGDSLDRLAMALSAFLKVEMEQLDGGAPG